MADPTLAEFRTRFAEYSETTDEVVTAALELAVALCGEAGFQPTLHATAHILALADQETGHADGGSGIVSMEILGPRTVQYQNMAKENRERFFEQTAYGRMVLATESRSPAGMAVFFA